MFKIKFHHDATLKVKGVHVTLNSNIMLLWLTDLAKKCAYRLLIHWASHSQQTDKKSVSHHNTPFAKTL